MLASSRDVVFVVAGLRLVFLTRALVHRAIPRMLLGRGAAFGLLLRLVA